MPALAWFERRTGKELGSASVVADSKQILLCVYLSGLCCSASAASTVAVVRAVTRGPAVPFGEAAANAAAQPRSVGSTVPYTGIRLVGATRIRSHIVAVWTPKNNW